jgi:glycosyltransferase involved in cell wall biosynthesis
MIVGCFSRLVARRWFGTTRALPNSILDKFWISKGLRRCDSKLFDLFERAVVRFFDLVIYTTPFVGARYQKLKVRSGRIENYPIVALSDTFAKDPQKKIIYLGAMSRIRGLVELIEAFALVVARHPDWRLVLVGVARPASVEDELKTLARQRGIENNVISFPGCPTRRRKDSPRRPRSGSSPICLTPTIRVACRTSCLTICWWVCRSWRRISRCTGRLSSRTGAA